MSDLDAIAALHDPLRRRLYEYVVAQAHEVSRAEAADAADIQRTLAAFHLDKLVEAGLLQSVNRRLTGRTGPGAGRPAKLYRRTVTERSVSLPPRAYDLAAGVFAEAVEKSGADDEVYAAARARGRELGSAGGSLREILERGGYEPYEDGEALRLRNCPFHQLAREYPPLACGMNLALCKGVLEGLGEIGLEASLDPRHGECCVVLHSKNNDS